MQNGITFTAYFSKASTLVDGGWRISFDLSNQDGNIVAELAKLQGESLQIGVVSVAQISDEKASD